MLTTKKIQERYGGNICRQCINHEYRVHLERRDCRYGEVEECPACGSLHHMVTGFKLAGMARMLLK